MNEPSKPKNTQQFTLRINYCYVAVGLLLVIIVMFLIWKPWSGSTATDRTVEVTGQATLSATPDEFVFYPTYDFKNADKDAALNALTIKNNEVIAKLKALGVDDSKIKSNSDTWSYPIYMYENDSTATYTLRLTITVDSKELAQKVQDYLLTTTPSGTISPQADFSDKKRRQIEDQARDEASKDARKKAEKSAENLGFKLAAVKAVTDSSGFGGGYLYSADKMVAPVDSSATTSLPVQPGENELTYTVTVTYFIK